MSESDFLKAQMEVWGQETLHDSRNPRVSQVVRHQLKQLLRCHVGEGRLLDVGGYRGLQVEGLNAVVHDMSWPALKDCLTRQIPASLGDIHHLPYADQSLDGVLSSHVLEHSHQPQDLLDEIARVLKPGAPLVVVVPNAAGLMQLIKLWRFGDVRPSGNLPWDPPEHLHQFTLANTLKALKQWGWQVRHVEGDILDFPLRDKLKCFRLAGWLGKRWPRRAESLIAVVTRQGAS